MDLEKQYREQTSLEHRKKYAQFFTPEQVARFMVDWLLDGDKNSTLLEPALGLGIFSDLVLKKKRNIQIDGFEVDTNILAKAKERFQQFADINFFLQDYISNGWQKTYDVIICNPPYFKFHNYSNKKAVEEINKHLNINLSASANIYTLFLLKAVYQLNKGGRAAFIVPSEFLNANYGEQVKQYLIDTRTLKHVIYINFENNIFADALTTSTIIFLQKEKKEKNNEHVSFFFIDDVAQLKNFSFAGGKKIKLEELNSRNKWRMYYQDFSMQEFKNLIPFNNIAKVVRGIASGANKYFVFNEKKAKAHNIKKRYLLPCIIRSKDVTSSFFTVKDFLRLKNSNKNIFLFSLNSENGNSKNKAGFSNANYQNALRYIKLGEEQNIHRNYLTSKRKIWYAQEKRPPSPIWAGVFNRDKLKFVRNEAGISNLTTFHCVYLNANVSEKINIDLLFAYLLTETAQNFFNRNRREYAGGLKKMEPNDFNLALMLDLSKLNKKNEEKIMQYYRQYRNSALEGKVKEQWITKINNVFIEVYHV